MVRLGTGSAKCSRRSADPSDAIRRPTSATLSATNPDTAGSSARSRRPVKCGVSIWRSRVCSGGSVNPSPPGSESAPTLFRPTRLPKSLLKDSWSAKTWRTSS